MKKIIGVLAALVSISTFSIAEGDAGQPIEASTFFEIAPGIVGLNATKASEQGYSSSGYSASGSVGIILGHFRGGIGAVGILPSDQDYNNLVDEEGYEVVDADIAFTGFNAFAGGRYLYLDKYEFNIDVGLTTMGNFQVSDVIDEQEASLESSGGLFIRPSFNYYITSFVGVHASYMQMIGSETTARSFFSAGVVLKL